jgi:RNA recognition motif-containing protein
MSVEQVEANHSAQEEEVEEDIEEEEDEIEDEKAENAKRRKPGLVYLSTIPPRMNVQQLREYFARFGEIGRVYLQPEDRKFGSFTYLITIQTLFSSHRGPKKGPQKVYRRLD